MYIELKNRTYNNTQFYYTAGNGNRANSIVDGFVCQHLECDKSKHYLPIPDELSESMGQVVVNPRGLLLNKDNEVVAFTSERLEVCYNWDGVKLNKIDVFVDIINLTDGNIMAYEIPSDNPDAYKLKHEHVKGFLQSSSDYMVFEKEIVPKNSIAQIQKYVDVPTFRMKVNSYIDSVVSKGILLTIEREDETFNFRDYFNSERIALLALRASNNLGGNEKDILYIDADNKKIYVDRAEINGLINTYLKCEMIINTIQNDLHNRINNSENLNELDYKYIVNEYFKSYSDLFCGNNSL